MRHVALDELAAALDLGDHELVSLVGGGGKTTALFALGRQLAGGVVLTTTTKMGTDRTDGNAPLLAPGDDDLVAAVAADGSALVWRSIEGHKAIGVERADCDRWFGLTDHVVVEADGSRRRPLTAPGPFEPVIPSATTILVACVGADALGRVIADACHRPMRVAAAAGCSPGDRLTPDRLARLIVSERGLRKDLPDGARQAVMIAGVDDADLAHVGEVADSLGAAVPLVAVRRDPRLTGT